MMIGELGRSPFATDECHIAVVGLQLRFVVVEQEQAAFMRRRHAGFSRPLSRAIVQTRREPLHLPVVNVIAKVELEYLRRLYVGDHPSARCH